jgi:hypothetical protein
MALMAKRSNTPPSIEQVNKWVDEFEESYQQSWFRLKRSQDGVDCLQHIESPSYSYKGVWRAIAVLGLLDTTSIGSRRPRMIFKSCVPSRLREWLESYAITLTPQDSYYVPDNYYTQLEIKRADLEAERLMHEQRKAAQEDLKTFDQLLGEHGEGLTAVYSIETGEMKVVHQIDADCYLRTGEWTVTSTELKSDELPDELLGRLSQLSQEALNDFDKKLRSGG